MTGETVERGSEGTQPSSDVDRDTERTRGHNARVQANIAQHRTFIRRPPAVYEEPPDDAEPDNEWRQITLQKVEENLRADSAPYFDVSIDSVGQLLWIMRENGWSGNRLNLIDALQETGPADLRYANLVNGNFQKILLVRANLEWSVAGLVDLSGADLSEARLSHASWNGGVILRGTIFTQADMREMKLWHHQTGRDQSQGYLPDRQDLSGAILIEANASGANLQEADLHGANLRRCNLHAANLRDADLTGTDFTGANLTGADLRGARMDVTTTLDGAQVDEITKLAGVIWNGAPLTGVDWRLAPRLGDEPDVQQPMPRAERANEFESASSSYSALSSTLRSQGLLNESREYRTRGLVTSRKALFYRRRYDSWLTSWVLNVTSGYGELPGRALVLYIALVLCFAASYLVASHGFRSSVPHLTPQAALVFSVTSFHGRGQATGLRPNDPLAVISGLEAVVGLFVEISFIAAFTRRLMG